MANTFDGDVLVRGTLRCGGFQPPLNSVGNTQFNSADPLAATKQDHQYVKEVKQAHGTAVVARREVIHRAHAAGSIVGVDAGLVVACVGGATVTIDIKKNGTTVLSGSVVLDNTNSAFTSEAGAFSSTTLAAGDVLEADVTVAAGGGTIGQGLYVSLVVREAAD